MLEPVNCKLCLEEEEGSCLSCPASYVQAVCSVSYLYRSTECMPGPGLTGPRREGRGRGVVLSSRHVGLRVAVWVSGASCLTPPVHRMQAWCRVLVDRGHARCRARCIGADHRGARESRFPCSCHIFRGRILKHCTIKCCYLLLFHIPFGGVRPPRGRWVCASVRLPFTRHPFGRGKLPSADP